MTNMRQFSDPVPEDEVDPLAFGNDPTAAAAYYDSLTFLRLRAAAKAARNECGLSQTAVAERMGTTQSAVSDLESGRGDAQLNTWQRYARAVSRRFAFSLERPHTPVQIPVAALALSPVLTELSRAAKAQTVHFISKEAKLPVPLVTRILARLTDEGWALPSREGESDSYSLVDEAANLIGMSLHGDRIVGVLIDMKGRLQSEIQTYTLVSSTPETVVASATQLTESLFNISRAADKHVLGVGVCLAGLVDADTGRVSYAPDLESRDDGWADVDLETMLQERIQNQVHEALRVAVSNDANALALSHYRGRHFAPRSAYDLTDYTATSAALILISGAGVGAGFIVNGNLLQGANSKAGEIGHLIVDRGKHAPPCRMGRKHTGCLETVATPRGVLRALDLPADTSTERKQSLELANAKIQEGDKKYREAFFTAGKRLGSVLPLISILDAEEVTMYCAPALHLPEFATARAFQEGVGEALNDAERSGVLPSEYPALRWLNLEEDTLARAAGVAMLVSQFLQKPSDWYPGLEQAIDRDSELVLA